MHCYFEILKYEKKIQRKRKKKKKKHMSSFQFNCNSCFPRFIQSKQKAKEFVICRVCQKTSWPWWATERKEKTWILNRIQNWKILNPSHWKKNFIREKHWNRVVYNAMFANCFVHMIVLLFDFLIAGKTDSAVFVLTTDVFLLSICSHFFTNKT